MNISYNWLKQYVRHPWTPHELAEALTMSSLEVEEIHRVGTSYEGIIVGEVVEVRPHPNADRLTLCSVDIAGSESLQIVCGAPNVATGQKVPVATEGATVLVPDRNDPSKKIDLRIKRTKLRGEASEGMICAEDELGLSEDHSGIMVLDDQAEPGLPFGDYLKRKGLPSEDFVLDVAITPNRPDAVSHIGIARDVAALSGTTLNRPGVELPTSGAAVTDQVSIRIEAPDGCPRYSAVLVKNVRIAESPPWIKQRLTAVGLRPRNNVVDVTNFVMYECGQPLHAFDFDRLEGREIVVRTSQPNEPFITLDGRGRILPEGTLLICDARRPVAIAGIMGGEDSEVTESTAHVLIESAWFNPSVIRRGARALGLQTDSSYRFERGTDPEGTVWAAMRAAQLMAELAGGEIVPGVADAYIRPHEATEVVVRPSRVEHVLGHAVPENEIRSLLQAIGCDVHDEEDRLLCKVPSFRPDIEREIDLIEEIARLYGYDRIPERSHTSVPFRPVHTPDGVSLRSRARSALAGLGYRDIYTNSMLRRETAERFADGELNVRYEGKGAVVTLNPISQEMAALRASLLPGALQVIAHNQHHGQRELRMAELGRVFQKSTDPDTPVRGYEEHESLLMALSGPVEKQTWYAPERTADFFDLKGHVRSLFDALKIPSPVFATRSTESLFFGQAMNVLLGNDRVGYAGRLSNKISDEYDLREAVYAAEFHWDLVLGHAMQRPSLRYTPIRRHPVVERDIAILVDRHTPAAELLATIRDAGTDLLRSVRIFDLYEGDRIGGGKKSIAFALTFGADRTLVDAEVDERVNNIIKYLSKEHGATLRQ